MRLSGYVASRLTQISSLPYLTEDAIGRTLDYIASIRRSEVVFDYMGGPEGFSEELRQLEKVRDEQLKKMGERSVSRFEPAEITALVRSHGFVSIEHISFQEIASNFGSAVQGLAAGHLGVGGGARQELNEVCPVLASRHTW